MKKARVYTAVTAIALIFAIAFNLVGCSTASNAKNLMENVTPRVLNELENLDDKNANVTDFAVRLFKESVKNGENTLISPLSVMCALAMTANGAEDETLSQMENVLGMSRDELNAYLHSYTKNLPRGEKYKLDLANSIWFTDDERFSVNNGFLQTTADFYDADIYKAPFNNKTKKDINSWVNEKTDGTIPEILDEIPQSAVMYLVNALAFDAEWSTVYMEHQVRENTFTKEDGTKQEAEFMYSGIEEEYLEDEKATGFIKEYKGGKYAFVAMLPKEGVSVSEYVSSLDGNALHTLLSNPEHVDVHTSIPKFETSYGVEMSDILTNMGMPKAFSENAEFGSLGTSSAGNICISRVIHKTFISVHEKGTKAGAATLVEMVDGGMPQDYKEVHLTRPFVYMLIDRENNIPFFIGTMTDVKA